MNKRKNKKGTVDFFYKTIWKDGDPVKVPYEFSPGEKDKYIQTCQKIPHWGGVPLHVPWAMSTNSYQDALKEKPSDRELLEFASAVSLASIPERYSTNE